MAKKSKKQTRRGQTKKKSPKRRKKTPPRPSQTNEPLEQGRMGQYGGAGEPPIIK